MYCPKCGGEASEGQKFCKNCGTDLQIVSDAIGRGDDSLGQLRVDLDSLKRGIKDVVATSVKYGKQQKRHGRHGRYAWGAGPQGWSGNTSGGEKGATTTELANDGSADQVGAYDSGWYPTETAAVLSYSRQHNLKKGLLSLFGGAGLGIALYMLGKVAIESGLIAQLEAQGRVQGVHQLAAVLWIFAAIPVLKGLGQIIYGTFFAESISTMTERFAPPRPIALQPDPSANAVNNRPIRPEEAFNTPPLSVTEQTTSIFDKKPGFKPDPGGV
ncbi:MAG TPA: zinc ribbon domain-containing protein [Blastocatellia bacterium]|nr:zinc ribbon domain-containing protein [Blastocatellia bacterium]